MKMCKHKAHKCEIARSTKLTTTAATRPGKDFGRSARKSTGNSMTNETDTYLSDTPARPPRGPRRSKRRHKVEGPARHRRRMLAHGDLKYLLLEFIAQTPRTGYDLMSEIETLSEGRYRPSPGVLYPAVELMRDMGWITDTALDGKRVLSLTEAGQKARAAEAAKIADITAKLAKADGPKRRGGELGDAHPRALLNRIKHITRKKLENDASKETEVLTILTEALEKLEKL